MTAKFSIKNTTERYNGRDLATLVRACLRSLTGLRQRRIARSGGGTITVVTYHPRRTYAHAEIDEHGFRTLKLASPEKLWKSAVDALAGATAERNVPTEAFIAICECVYFLVTGDNRRYADVPIWAQGKRVRVSPPPEKPEKLVGLDYHRDKLEHEEAKLAEWQAKLAQAEKQAKKWRKAVRSRKGVIRRLKKTRGISMGGPGGDR